MEAITLTNDLAHDGSQIQSGISCIKRGLRWRTKRCMPEEKEEGGQAIYTFAKVMVT